MGRKNRNRKTGKKNRGSNKQPKYQNQKNNKGFIYVSSEGQAKGKGKNKGKGFQPSDPEQIWSIAREVFGSLYWCAADDD